MRLSFSVLTFFISANALLAQGNEDTAHFDKTIVTDRPDQTETSCTTPKGWFQGEFGSQKEYDHSGVTKTQKILFYNSLVKYGISNRLEVRLVTEFAGEKTTIQHTDSSSVSDQRGFSPVSVGCKISICEERGVRPKVSLLSHLVLSYFGKKEFRPKYNMPQFRMLFMHTISNRISFSYNTGLEWEVNSTNPTFIYTGSLGCTLFKNAACFLEGYGFLKEDMLPDNRLDAGFTYCMTDHIQYDIAGGIGLNTISPTCFITTGLSIRINGFDSIHRKW